MTADEARAFARVLIHLADQADPVSLERAFGEDLVRDVPAPNGPSLSTDH